MWADDTGDRLAAALEGLASPSLFGGPQVVVVRRAEALRDEQQERVLAVLPGLGTGGSLVLVSRGADQRKRLFAACIKAGVAYGFPPVDLRGAQAWVTRLARERGADIAPPAVEELVDRTGADLGALAQEVEKLAVRAGAGRRIEAADVRAVVGAVRGRAVEELTDRLARRDLAGAVRVLRALFADGEAPLRVLGFLAANLRRALHVAELAEAGLRQDEIGARLGMPSWLVARNAGRGRARDLRHALHTLRRLDEDLKSTPPAEAVFEAAITTIATRDHGAGRDGRRG